MYSRWQRYQLPEDFPTGTFGDWIIKRVHPSNRSLNAINLSLLANNMEDRQVRPGSYVLLSHAASEYVIMSDTTAEIHDLYPLFDEVNNWGNDPEVLIHGLGLGVALQGVMLEGASKVTVVEKDKELLDVVGSYWKEIYECKLELINDDAMTWAPSKNRRWDIAWHDIWPYICADNLKSMHRLHRRFGHRVSWQGSWCRRMCENARRRKL